MKTHELKTLPEYFEQVWNGNKKFELRKNDRDFQYGDCLILKEFKDGIFTKRTATCFISYILKDLEGIESGYCVLGIRSIYCEINS